MKFLIVLFSLLVCSAVYAQPIEPEPIPEDPVPIPEQEPTAAELADKVIDVNGTVVRVIGIEFNKEAAVEITAVGETVIAEYGILPDTVYCNVILDAVPIAEAELYKDGGLTIKEYPNIPAFKDAFRGRASRPVVISGSEDGDKKLWNVLFKGQDCVNVALLDEYIGSSAKEVWNHSEAMRTRFFRTQIIEKTVDGDVGLTLKWGDPKAPIDAVWRSNHNWFGRRHDFGFKPVASDGVLQPRLQVIP